MSETAPSGGDRSPPSCTFLFAAGVAAGVAAVALPQASHSSAAYVRDGLAGVASAIVSAGAFVAWAIARRR